MKEKILEIMACIILFIMISLAIYHTKDLPRTNWCPRCGYTGTMTDFCPHCSYFFNEGGQNE